ncbi:hypothetical protein BGY98DRAFT_1095677 [Russula aff. rugulosa BPL654]|nr:hypothetical protein BGY98DRAFT_1095677 [Russula aff. rugulosa BPL654]
MDRSPPTHWQGASFENAFQTPQQQQPTRAQYPPTRRHSIASYRPALPSESRMPDEWGYPSSSVPHISSAPFFTDASYHSQYFGIGRYTKEHTGPTAPTIPTCRYPNCPRPVTMDERARELTEYCSPEHMRFVVLFLQGPPSFWLPQWAMQQQRQQQHQHQQQQHQQQEHHQQLQQQRQHWQSSTMGPGPPPMVPNPNAITWTNAARGAAFPKKGIWKQVRFEQ